MRNYERDLADLRIPLAKVLEPIGVHRVVGNVTAIDVANRQVVCEAADGRRVLAYDRLVLALGGRCCVRRSRACWNTASTSTPTPPPSGLRPIAALATRPPATGRYTAIVVGGGLTGIEWATEIIATLSAASARRAARRPGSSWSTMPSGSAAAWATAPAVSRALAALGVEARPACRWPA